MTDKITIPEEFKDIIKVLENGAEKYGADSWLEPGGLDFEANHDSMSHHLLDSAMGKTEDKDSELHPLLHLACRALMGYTLWKRGI